MDSDLSELERKLNKAKLLGHSTVLNKYKISNYPEFIPVVDYLYDEMVTAFGLVLTLPSSIKNMKYHIEFFVLNLYKTYCNDPTKVISYSRAISEYSGKKSKLKNKFRLSFRYSVEGGKNGKGVLNFLEKLKYIENFGFQYDKSGLGNSYQSRMRATKKLIDLIKNQYKISDENIIPDFSNEETIIVKGVKPKPTHRYVVENGKKKRKKIQRPRKICKTLDTPKVREMRKNLELINMVMDEAEIKLDITPEELTELNERLNNDRNPYKQTIDFSRKRLHRVFLDRRLDRGGRFYGAWYQNVPKEYRNRILINGMQTVESDYSTQHPYLLYAKKGVSPPDGDLYALDSYSADTRKFLKGLFLRIINSKSREDAKGSIREAAFLKKKVKIPEELGNLGDEYLDPLIDKFAEKHKLIADYFFNDYGTNLQWIDSQIAEAILVHFAKKGQPCLPMHDSFIIDSRLGVELFEAMEEIAQEGLKQEIPITDNLDQQIYRMLDKVNEDSKDWEKNKDRLVPLFKKLEKTHLSVKKRFAELEAQAEAEEE